MPTSIRSEQPADHAAIAAVQRAAFARDAEANLVSALRHDGLMLVSLVALHGEIIIGHVMFSTLRVEVSGRELVAATLAPLAVVPDFQRRGYGSALVRAGIAFCGSVDRTYRLSYLPAALCTIPMRGRAEGGGIGRSSISRRRCTAWRLAPAVRDSRHLPAGASQGRNDFGLSQYSGPCPPVGDHAHHYEITVYAVKVRYPFSLRIRTLRAILNKLRPEPVRKPLPPPKVYAPPRATAARRRRTGQWGREQRHNGVNPAPAPDEPHAPMKSEPSGVSK